ncbi:MAG: hypothetical protein ACREQ4_06655 [Candidatus Binataceae bacterium]
MKQTIACTIALLTAIAAGISLRFLIRPSRASRPVTPASAHFLPALAVAQGARSQPLSRPGLKSTNVLILPKASPAFIGYWGGFVHSRIHSIIPGYLTGSNPARVSVMFGQAGDTIFMASELYSSHSQRIIGRPRARIISPGQAVITYASEDRQLYYRCRHSFTLTPTDRIQYRAAIAVYQRATRALVGTVSQHAWLTRMVTARRRREFARPSANGIPRGAVAASSDFAPSNAREKATLELPAHGGLIPRHGS